MLSYATQVKGYPFEVLIVSERPCAVLADQIKSLDWVARKASHKGKVSRRIASGFGKNFYPYRQSITFSKRSSERSMLCLNAVKVAEDEAWRRVINPFDSDS